VNVNRSLTAILLVLNVAVLAGCRGWNPWIRRPPPCTFAPTATKQELVAHVNRNITPPTGLPAMTAWRCVKAHVQVNNFPIRADANVDISAPHKFRVRAANPFTGSAVADLGSNESDVWFWFQDAPGIMTVSHEVLPDVLSRMEMPIDPDWVMEVLGVVPLDGDSYRIDQPDAPVTYMDLVAERAGANGELYRRIVRIDRCQGHIIEHRIESLDGKRIAWALLSDYRPDLSGQYELPHFIQLECPAAKSQITIQLSSIEVNPVARNDSAWQIPNRPGVPRLQFDPNVIQAASATRSSAPRPLPRPERQPLPMQSGGVGRVMIPDLSEDAPPAAYSAATSQSSSGRLP